MILHDVLCQYAYTTCIIGIDEGVLSTYLLGTRVMALDYRQVDDHFVIGVGSK